MLNENIKKYRKEKGFSQDTLAQELNVVRQTVSKWEKGISVPDADMLIKLSDALEVSIITLLGGTEESEKNMPDNSAVANQLYILNNQFAKELFRRKRNRSIALAVLLCLLVILPLILIFILVPLRNAPVESGFSVTSVPSEIFTEDEIDSAIEAVADNMDRNWNGCRLIKIRYAGDGIVKREMSLRGEQLKQGDIIILLSDFYVGKHGGDGSLNTDFTYTDWSWILVKTATGGWTELDHGYG